MPHKESKTGYLSVTEVLGLVINKPFLALWRGKIGNELAGQVQRESQELGIEVHDAIEKTFNDVKLDDLSPNAKRMVENFWEMFVRPWEAKPVLLEASYEDESLKLQGTMDALLRTKKGPRIVDFKTSNQIDKISVPLQLCAYAHLSGQGVWEGLVVRIDKVKNKVEVKEYKDLKKYLPVFLDCLRVARYIKFGEVGGENDL